MAVRYRFEGLIYDPENRELTRDGVANLLPLQEAIALEALLKSACRLLPKQELARLIRPDEKYGEFDLAINNIISRLRRSLGEDAKDVRCIKTIPKAGYRMICEISVESVDAPSEDSQEAVLDPPLPPPVFEEPASAVVSEARSTRRSIIWLSIAGIVCILLAGGAYLYHARREASTAPTNVLGILPLTVTGSPSSFTEETIRGELADAVAQIPGVQVRAAHSLTAEMGKDALSLQKAAKELSLNLLLTGSLAITDKGYQFDMELVRGSDDAHLRSFHFTGPIIGLSNLPNQVEESLFHYLNHSSDTPGTTRGQENGTISLEAYNDAFQGSQALTERSQASLQRAVELFRRATELNPNFARAYSGLAETYLVLADLGAGKDVASDFDLARQAALKAIELDPSDARSHSVLGLILFQRDWRLPEAERELRAAIRLNPGLAANHMRLAVLLADMKQFAAASEEIATAHQLDPLWPVVYGTDMYVRIMARQYAQAIEAGQALVASRPDWGRAHQQLGWALWYGGQKIAAVQEWQQAAVLDHDTNLALQESHGLDLLRTGGVRAYAHAKLEAAQHSPQGEDFVPAEWHAFAGDKAETLDALDKLVHQHDPESLKISINPAYDFLHIDVHFKELESIVIEARERPQNRKTF